MSLRPFPSRQIALYTARMFVVRVAAFLVMLVLILQTLDLLNESNKILAGAGHDDSALMRYVLLRLPQLVETFLPFSVLLGTLVTLATLNQNSEVVIFKAAGISAHQILAPLIVAALGVAVVSFAFNELVLTRTNVQLNAWQKAGYGTIAASGPAMRETWIREGNSLMRAGRVEGSGRSTRLRDFSLYIRVDNQLKSILRATEARPVAGGWRLTGVREFDVVTGLQSQRSTQLLPSTVDPARFTTHDISPDEVPFWQLRRDITAQEAAGRPSDHLRVALYHKLSGPLSAMLMPILGAVAAFGLARSGKLFVRSVIGIVLGFAYFVADNFMVAMGQFGAAPPWLAAWAPFLLFYLIGEAVLFRTEE